MARRKTKVSYDTTKLPNPPIVQKNIIDNINKRLDESRSGNYRIKLLDISEARRSFCSYEYHLDLKVNISNLNDAKATTGLMVPGMGAKPIQLGNRVLHVNPCYFDFWDMEDQIFDRLNKKQLNINEEGYYLKEKK